jgi:Ser/Thr protein kinase RdoA (MazF antagonist)
MAQEESPAQNTAQIIKQNGAQDTSQNIDEEISRVLSFYPVGSLKKVTPAVGGVMNENWFVDTDTGKYFLRRRNLFFTFDSIDFELQLIEYISELGFPTPRLIHTSEGGLYVPLEGRTWELYEYISGEPFRADNLAQTKSAARLLARFHMAAAGYHVKVDIVSSRKIDLGTVAGMINQFEEQVKEELKTSTLGTLIKPGITGLIDAQVEVVLSGIQPLSGSLLTIIHGDFQPSNVIFRGDDAVALIDFGNAALSYRSYDVARAILGFSTLRPDYSSQSDLDPWLDMNRAKAFFRAYQADMPISDAEIQAMPALIRGTFIFGISYYMKIEEDLMKKAALLVNAISFIRWLDATEAELRDILLQEAQSLKAEAKEDQNQPQLES